jgi:hypothetical protein
MVWCRVTAQRPDNTKTAFSWSNSELAPGTPPAVTMPIDCRLDLDLIVTGGDSPVSYSFEVLIDAGSTAFQLPDPGSLLSGNGLAVGMPVLVPQEIPPDGLPNGLAIVAVNQPTAGSIQLGGGGDGRGQIAAPWVYQQPTSKTLDTTITALEPEADGWITMSVSPSTGVEIQDWSGGTTGDGSKMQNNSGQACGYTGITFPSPGSYIVTASYTSTDANYADVAGTLAVTVTA